MSFWICCVFRESGEFGVCLEHVRKQAVIVKYGSVHSKCRVCRFILDVVIAGG